MPDPTPATPAPTLVGVAGPDPWALTPEEQADLDARRAKSAAELAAIPEEPPF